MSGGDMNTTLLSILSVFGRRTGGLLYKDCLNLKTSLISVLFICVVFSVVFIPIGNTFALFLTIMMAGAYLALISMTFDDVERWHQFVLTTPASRKEVIREKYILMGLLLVCACVLSAIIVCILKLVFPEAVSAPWMLSMLIVTLACGVLHGSLTIPLNASFGMVIARYVAIALMVVMALLFATFFFVVTSLIQSGVLLLIASLGLLALSIVISVVSYRVSLKMYEKKDF